MSEITNRDALFHEIDMLNDNVNRMVLADSKAELDSMREFALLRIEAIYEYVKRSL